MGSKHHQIDVYLPNLLKAVSMQALSRAENWSEVSRRTSCRQRCPNGAEKEEMAPFPGKEGSHCSMIIGVFQEI